MDGTYGRKDTVYESSGRSEVGRRSDEHSRRTAQWMRVLDVPGPVDVTRSR